MNKKTKKVVFGIVALVLAIAALALLYLAFAPKPKNIGSTKKITVTVVYADESTKDFIINTNEDYLRGALEKEKLISGSESEYGLFVTTVDNVTASDADRQWWAFYLNDEMLMTGVDTTPVNDGDHFTIALEVY